MIGNMVSIATDLSSGWTLHELFPPFIDVYDGSAPMNWAVGAGFNRHSLSSNVRHKGQALVLDGHDLGPQLPHAPMNFGVHQLKSSRKGIYTASTILANGKAIACIDESKGTKMMLCGDPVSLPFGSNNTNSAHSVSVGMSELDYFKGYASIAASVAVDLVSWACACAGGDGANLVSDVLLDTAGISWEKAKQAAVAGLITSTAVSYKSDWREPITIKLETGGGLSGASLEHQWTPSSGSHQSKIASNAEGINVEASTDYSKVTTKHSAWGGEPVQETWGESL